MNKKMIANTQHSILRVCRLGLYCLLFCGLLSSCGFHLRQASFIPQHFQKVMLETNTPYSALTQQLKREMRYAKAHLANHPKQASIILAIQKEELTVRQNSISSAQQMRHYRVSYQVTYTVRSSKGHLLLKPTRLQAQDKIVLMPNETLENNHTLNQVKQDLIQNLTTQIMNRFIHLLHDKQHESLT